MKCPNCNTKNIDEAVFCKHCGLDLRDLVARGKEHKHANDFMSTYHDYVTGIDQKLLELSSNVDALYDRWNAIKEEYNAHVSADFNSKIESLEIENEQYREIIEVQKKQLDELQKQLGNITICPNCNKKYNEKVMFCSECGTKLS